MPPKTVNASRLDASSTNLHFRKTPDECPMCHRGIHPRLVGAVVVGDFNQVGSELRVIFQCTRSECQEAFLGYGGYSDKEGSIYLLERVAPKTPDNTTFSESITELSKNFVEIYNQSMTAEAASLDQIAGIGLRKALEFLVKDFLIKQEPSKAEEIKGKLLGPCINDYVSDTNIQATAKLAAWLGNDETHYVRKWEDKDINDLKVLIRLTVNWVDNVLLTQKYIAEMNP